MSSFIKTVLPAVIVMAVVAVGAETVYTKYFNPGSDTVVSSIAPAAGDPTAAVNGTTAGSVSGDVAAGTTDSVQGTTDTTPTGMTTNGATASTTDGAAPTTTSPSTNAVTSGNAAIGTTSTGQDAAATDKNVAAPAATH